MLYSIKGLYEKKLGASDGEIGHVKDFYFDDQNWAIRYVVANTGSWLAGRQVLISPHAFGKLDVSGKALGINLTRKQLEDCPSIDSHKPVSRHYEEEYYRYYGWPFYWRGDALWGMSGFPILELPPEGVPYGSSNGNTSEAVRSDAHLRSTQDVCGYNITANNETVGHVCDFLMDVQSWAIPQLVAKTGHRLSGKELPLPSSLVESISWDDSTVFVKMSKKDFEQGAAEALLPNLKGN
jgi:hypothetical protein